MHPNKVDELIRDVYLNWYDKHLLIQSELPLRIVSSAILYGGLQEKIHSILNLSVEKGYCGMDPVHDLQQAALHIGLPEKTVGLMTAVDVKNAVVKIASTETVESTGVELLQVAAVVTAGASNAWRAGEVPTYLGQSIPSELNPYPPGTVNIVVIVDGQMTDGAMVNGVMTVTEAKTALFYDRNILCRQSGKPATGTTTDAVVMAATGRGKKIEYGGPGSEVGVLIARTVSKALHKALDNWEKSR